MAEAVMVALLTADMRALPLTTGSVHLVVSSLAIHNVSDWPGRTRVVGEAVRLLRPGGRLVIADFRYARAYADYLTSLGLADVTVRDHTVIGQELLSDKAEPVSRLTPNSMIDNDKQRLTEEDEMERRDVAIRDFPAAAYDRAKRAAAARDLTIGEYLAALVDLHERVMRTNDAKRALVELGLGPVRL